MEHAYFQPEIFISLAVILGTAFVAFICDFLKRNNEQLRELTIELKVGQEETQRRGQMMTPRVAERAVPPVPVAEVEQPKQPARKVFGNAHAVATPLERKRVIAPDALAAMERGARLAGVARAKAAPPGVAQPADQAAAQPAAPAASETVLHTVPTGFHEGYI